MASARILPFEFEEEEAYSVLLDLVYEMTDLSVSSRLLDGDSKASERAVKVAVKMVYHTHPSVENEKMIAVAAAFRRRGVRLSARTTWAKSDFAWTPEELDLIDREFGPMFTRADSDVPSAALAHFIGYMKGKTGGEVVRDVAPPFVWISWHELGKHEKKTAFKKKLLDLGWLVIVTHPYKPHDGRKGRATGYAIGPAAKKKFTGITKVSDGEEDRPEWMADVLRDAACLL